MKNKFFTAFNSGDQPHYFYRIFFCDPPDTSPRHLSVPVHAGAGSLR